MKRTLELLIFAFLMSLISSCGASISNNQVKVDDGARGYAPYTEAKGFDTKGQQIAPVNARKASRP